jgi:two-component system, OmpR family, phosphate regulon sensor histidine kinase PhoR
MTHRRKLIWKLYPSFFLTLVLVVAAVTVFFGWQLKVFYLAEIEDGLASRAALLAGMLEGDDLTDATSVDATCVRAGEVSGTRFTVVLPGGRVVGDTEKGPEEMDNHADRPEIQRAMAGGRGMSLRFSYTLGREMMYVALPVERDGRVVAVSRASRPVMDLRDALRRRYLHVALAGLLGALLAALISLWISRRMIGTLETIQRGAERFAAGDLDFRLSAPDSEEGAAVVSALNRMGDQLSERLSTITGQRNELEAILANMTEGVLVLDDRSAIVRCNRSAERLFGLETSPKVGREVFEVVRNADLLQFVQRLYAAKQPLETEIVLHGAEDRFLQAHGTFSRDATGEKIQYGIIVLNDITKLKKLENVRRDFVANVSHELKTPITSILGFVETLRDGALEDQTKAREFLDIIVKQSNRLNAIIEDLLSLSRIEQIGETATLERERIPLRMVLSSAQLICANSAGAKDIRLRTRCDDAVTANVNSAMLEQAVVNLIDNAIKYSEPGAEVEIAAERENGTVRIDVRDQGCGIPESHLERVFERFYRVDSSRSRKMGGTGLGLAIVKHIVNAHGGWVTVSSEVGKGTVFSLFLPR